METRYSWDRDQLQKIFNNYTVKKIFSSSYDEKIKLKATIELYSSLIELLDNPEIPFPESIDIASNRLSAQLFTYERIMASLKKMPRDYEPYYNFFLRLTKNTARDCNLTSLPRASYPYTKEDIFTTMVDFFKMLDPKLYALFNYLFITNPISLLNFQSITSGQIRTSTMYRDLISGHTFCNVVTNDNILGFYRCAHEMTHAIQAVFDTSSLCSNPTKAMLCETPPILIEFILDDYLAHIGLPQDEIIKRRYNDLIFISTRSERLHIALLIRKVMLQNQKVWSQLSSANKLRLIKEEAQIPITSTKINKVAAFCPSHRPNQDSSSLSLSHTKSILPLSFIVALELYKQYTEDKEKAISHLKELFLTPDDMNLFAFLDSINIDLNLNTKAPFPNYHKYRQDTKSKMKKLNLIPK